jgi:DNA-binding GntR family transcriptional regulator
MIVFTAKSSRILPSLRALVMMLAAHTMGSLTNSHINQHLRVARRRHSPVFAVLRELLIQILDDFHFVVVQQTRLDVVVEGWEALLDTRRNVREDHGDAQADVSHDCTSHNPSLFCEWKLLGH